MSDQFLAEIRIYPFDFAPTGWAFCDGQLMPISQNTALFALLGTVYGGDGKSTFALPDLKDSAPMQPSYGDTPGGLSPSWLGEMSGVETVTLLVSEIPVHTHNLVFSEEAGNANNAAGNTYGTGETIYADPNNLVQMAPQSLALAGGSLPHNNMMPYLTLNFCIALQGIFPQRP